MGMRYLCLARLAMAISALTGQGLASWGALLTLLCTLERMEARRGAHLALLDGAAVLLVQAVRDGGSRGLIDDAHDVHPRDYSGVLGCLRIMTCTLASGMHHMQQCCFQDLQCMRARTASSLQLQCFNGSVQGLEICMTIVSAITLAPLAARTP